MTDTEEQTEKRAIITRLSTAIYKMSDERLLALLKLMEHKGIKKGEKPPPIFSSISKNTSSPKDRQLVIARLFVLINQMGKDELLDHLKEFYSGHKWMREYSRIPCNINVDFVAKDRIFNSYIRTISANGVFIESSDSFSEGQEILLCFTLSHEQVPFKIPSKIVRLMSDGIEVNFEEITPYQKRSIESLTGSKMEIKRMAEEQDNIDSKTLIDRLEMEKQGLLELE
jgi:Tfp pilus assembly protein PilZ